MGLGFFQIPEEALFFKVMKVLLKVKKRFALHTTQQKVRITDLCVFAHTGRQGHSGAGIGKREGNGKGTIGAKPSACLFPARDSVMRQPESRAKGSRWD